MLYMCINTCTHTRNSDVPETCHLSKRGCLQYNRLSMDDAGIGNILVAYILQGDAYFLLLLLIDTGILMKIYYKLLMLQIGLSTNDDTEREIGDSDVALERSRVLAMSPQQKRSGDVVILDHLTKVYAKFMQCSKTHLAVDRLTLGIPRGECFGLLGVNGAGKTTTFKMMTGLETVTSGTAYLAGHDITKEIGQVRRNRPLTGAVCVCVRACVRACVRVSVCVCIYIYIYIYIYI